MTTPNTSYQVRRDGAMQASGFARITEKGKYYGQFTRAEFVRSSRGSIGINFSFTSDDGATADFLSIWTQRDNGEELSGRNMLDALMTCMRVKTMDVRRAKIEKYNNDTKQREIMEAQIYPELMNTPIGLLLIAEEYLSHDARLKSRMVICGCFEAATDKTAREIWEKQSAKALPAIVASLRDKLLPTTTIKSGSGYSAASRPLAANTGTSTHANTKANTYAHARNGYPNQFDLGDDIPFNDVVQANH